MHAAIERVVHLRVRIDLLGHVAAGDEDHGRRFRAALHHVEVALKLGALEGNLDALDGVGGELDHLLVVGDAASVQVALLVIGLEARLQHRIHQRRLTPSCGGQVPTAERTVGPARMIAESLTPKPGIREHIRWKSGRAGAVGTPALKRTQRPFFGDRGLSYTYRQEQALRRGSVGTPIPFSSCPVDRNPWRIEGLLPALSLRCHANCRRPSCTSPEDADNRTAPRVDAAALLFTASRALVMGVDNRRFRLFPSLSNRAHARAGHTSVAECACVA